MTTTNRSHSCLIVGTVALLLLSTGCTSFELARLRNDIARDTPGIEIGDGYSTSFGRASIGLARFGIGLAGTSDSSTADVNRALRSVRRVQFARYPVLGRSSDAPIPKLPALERYERRGWTPALIVREAGSEVWLYTNERGDALSDGLLVTLADDALTLIRLSGNLDEAIKELIGGADIPRVSDIFGSGEPKVEMPEKAGS